MTSRRSPGSCAAGRGRWQPWRSASARHPARAEELAQEAFLRAYRRLGQWRGDAAFSTWLFAVATNVYRSEVRRVRPQEVELQETDGTPGDVDVLASIEASEQAAIVPPDGRHAATALSRRGRPVLLLRHGRRARGTVAGGSDGHREGAAASCAIAAQGSPLTYDGQELKERLMHVDLDDGGIDRALREERSLEPSPQFAARVMRSVREEADATQALPFSLGPVRARSRGRRDRSAPPARDFRRIGVRVDRGSRGRADRGG